MRRTINIKNHTVIEMYVVDQVQFDKTYQALAMQLDQEEGLKLGEKERALAVLAKKYNAGELEWGGLSAGELTRYYGVSPHLEHQTCNVESVEAYT